MAIAQDVSVRSNFPIKGERQIGASIVASGGEVLSVASIRSPNSSANPDRYGRRSVDEKYNIFKDKIDDWKEDLEKIKPCCNSSNIEEICDYLSDSLEFHPCTHAEISALLDCAKMGISCNGATLYTTTFPCHLCAKDIVTAGIKRVVYLEAYIKSKSRELYPEVIEFEPQNDSSSCISFDFFVGVGPSRFYKFFSLNEPLYCSPSGYSSRERDVMEYIVKKQNSKEPEIENYLRKLMGDSKKEE